MIASYKGNKREKIIKELTYFLFIKIRRKKVATGEDDERKTMRHGRKMAQNLAFYHAQVT